VATTNDSDTVIGGSTVTAVEGYRPAIKRSEPLVTKFGPSIAHKAVGGRRTPQEIKRLRREVMDFTRKMGQPVVLKHQWNNEDVRQGLAKQCPACFDPAYKQTRNRCPVCFSVGFVSVEDDDITNLYIEDGELVLQADQINEVPAPKYGGYGPGYITWLIEPDTPVDIFRINEQGVMVQTQSAQGVAPWFPELHDNDLAVNVHLTDNLKIEHVNEFGTGEFNRDYERYQLKLTNPITIRGFGKRAVDQDYQVQQTFEMAHIPLDNILYLVPLDR